MLSVFAVHSQVTQGFKGFHDMFYTWCRLEEFSLHDTRWERVLTWEGLWMQRQELKEQGAGDNQNRLLLFIRKKQEKKVRMKWHERHAQDKEISQWEKCLPFFSCLCDFNVLMNLNDYSFYLFICRNFKGWEINLTCWFQSFFFR